MSNYGNFFKNGQSKKGEVFYLYYLSELLSFWEYLKKMASINEADDGQ